VARLLARTPAAGLLPLTVGTCTLSEREPGPVTAIAPFPGDGATAAQALQAATGLAFPDPNRTAHAGDRRIVWSGHDQALVLGPPPGPIAGAAVTDQSDGWALLVLEGAGAEAVLARLVPLDLRPAAFPQGTAARSLLNHMPLVVWRDGADAFALMTFRSMAATAVHELAEAMRHVHARHA
jgi:heterotetrameric sarcosine oxidase gamma subunit